ncbi:hypothetical protein, partial [Klebsiella pneumoniae]|uniref:hypothetical protein n=1 Tax=Klebsiella pneumoniae TaxID=573 RepID=UPI001D12908E
IFFFVYLGDFFCLFLKKKNCLRNFFFEIRLKRFPGALLEKSISTFFTPTWKNLFENKKKKKKKKKKKNKTKYFMIYHPMDNQNN